MPLIKKDTTLADTKQKISGESESKSSILHACIMIRVKKNVTPKVDRIGNHDDIISKVDSIHHVVEY